MSPPGPRIAMAVLRKDLLLDLRTRERLGHMAVFAALVVVLLGLTLPTSRAARSDWIPALLWIVFLFTSLLGLSRSFQAETEEGAVAMLIQAPCDRGWVFLGKAAANLITLFGIQLWTALLFGIFLDVDWGPALPAALGVAFLGAAGLSALGSLLSAMSMFVRFRDFLFPILLFPLVLPLLVFASRMTATALEGGAISGLAWSALALYDWIFGCIGYFVFDYVLED
ncbi:MAG: heme exporter protein CcmB [Myxococcota bacterium]